MPTLAAENTYCLSFGGVENLDIDNSGSKEPGQTSLLPTVPPDLGENTCGNVEHTPLRVCQLDQSQNRPVISLKSDQRSAIEHDRAI